MTGKAAVHCHHSLFVGRDDLTTAIRAFICTYADLKLYCIKARNQKHSANAKNGDELPHSFGNQKCSNKDTGKQGCHAYAHNRPHR